MTKRHRLAGAFGLVGLAWAAVASAQPPWRAPPFPGLRAYRYEVIESFNGRVETGYRVDFDLDTSGGGTIDALVRSADESQDGKTWTAVAVGEACRLAMHAPPGGLARVRLWPVADNADGGLGASFLDTCAPSAVFLPLTDIVNVVIIPVSSKFGAAKLRRVGDSASYDGFTAGFDRAGQRLRETSPGGQISLVSQENGRTTLDWAPSLADLSLQEPGPRGRSIDLRGKEHFAFRVEIDTRSGALVSAHTTYDDLDLAMHIADVPADKLPRQAITRAVDIRPR
jgi:hypothetical protein